MTRQVTSKFIGFSFQIANFQKKLHECFDEFFDARTAVFLLNMNKRMQKTRQIIAANFIIFLQV